MNRHLSTLRPDSSRDAALQLFREASHSSYPVTDNDGKVQGVLLRQDFYDFLKQAEQSGPQSLENIPLNQLPLVTPDTPIETVLETLLRGSTNKVLVVDEEHHLQGILTILDMLEYDQKPGNS